MVAVVSAEGRFIFVSASAERLFGYDISDVVGSDAFGLFDSLSVEPVRALFDDLVARRRLSVSLEMQTVRADGIAIDLDVVAANHLDDPVGGIVVTIRDITARKQLEQRVHEVDRRQATLIESLADGVMMVDADGHRRPGQRGLRGDVRAPRIRVLGQRLETCWPGPRRPGAWRWSTRRAHVIEASAPPGAVASLRRGRRVGGGGPRATADAGRRPRWVRVNAQAMVGPDGRITGAVASFSDITDVHARPPPSCARRSSSSRCCSTRWTRASWPATPRAGSPCSTRRPAGSTGCDEDVEPIGRIPTDQGLLHADGIADGPRGEPPAPGHVGGAAPQRGDRPGVRGRATGARSASTARPWWTTTAGCSVRWWPCTTSPSRSATRSAWPNWPSTTR